MLPTLFQTPAQVRNYTAKVKRTAPANLIAYWPLAEASGVTIVDEGPNGYNGTYSNVASVLTGVTLGATGIGDGRAAATFDGATGYGNVYSASFAAAFDNQTITAALWVRQSDAASTVKRVLNIGADDSNRIVLQRNSTQQLQFFYIAGGTQKFTSTAYATTTWVHVAITVTKAGDAVKVYVAGVQSGATQTSLGVWAGALAATRCVIGANDTVPTLVWPGQAAQVAIWNTPLPAVQVAQLATVP